MSAGSLLPGAPALPARELSARVNTRRGVHGVSTERQSQGGAGAPPAKPGRGRGVQISLPWRGLPHSPGAPGPARGQVERGRGGGRAGPAPGVGPGGAGGAGPRYANVAHGRPIACAPRAAPSAPSRRRPRDQSERGSERPRSGEPRVQHRARARREERRSPARPPGPSSASRRAPPGRAKRSSPKPSARRRPRPAPGNAPSARRPGGARSPPGGRRPRAPLSLPMARAGARGLGC